MGSEMCIRDRVEGAPGRGSFQNPLGRNFRTALTDFAGAPRCGLNLPPGGGSGRGSAGPASLKLVELRAHCLEPGVRRPGKLGHSRLWEALFWVALC